MQGSGHKIARVELSYFPLRGVVEKIRLVLEASGTPYDDRRIKPKSEWPALKNSGEFLFKQVPKATIHFEDGEKFDLFQSGAIFRFIARKTGLLGSNEIEAAKVEMFADGVEDIRQKYVKVCYSPEIESLKTPYLAETVPAEFGKFEAALKANGTGYLVGHSLTAADLYFFDILENHLALAGEGILDAFPLIKQLHAHVAAHPKIRDYLASGRRPEAINGPTSFFGAYREQ
jgi:glutathione S-transferase